MEYQECQNRREWVEVRVASSDPRNAPYTVVVSPWNPVVESVCDCKGFEYRGHCRHQMVAAGQVCRWVEGGLPHQSPAQQAAMVCPRCGGPTVVIEEEDES